MIPIFLGIVKEGKFHFYARDKFDQYLQTLDGKQVNLIVNLPRKYRSNNENRYYWGVVIKLLSENTGYNENEMHDALRMLFLRDDSKKIPTLRSTTSLSTVEFEDYLMKIRMWSDQELSCFIPLPNEVDY